jgi:hypothetical protein
VDPATGRSASDETIAVEYQLTPEEIAACWAWEAYSQPRMYLKRMRIRRTAIRNLILSWSAAALMAVLYRVLPQPIALILLAISGIFAIAATFLFISIVSTPSEEAFARKRMPQARMAFESRTPSMVTISAEGVCIDEPTLVMFLRWPHYAALIETPQFLFGRLRDGALTVFPKRLLGEGETLHHNLQRIRAWAAAANVGEHSRLADYLRHHDVPCPRCAYNLRGIQAHACPECGFPLEPEAFAIAPEPPEADAPTVAAESTLRPGTTT